MAPAGGARRGADLSRAGWPRPRRRRRARRHGDRLLLEPELATDADRASEASEVMVEDRNRKLAVISSALVDLGIDAAIGVAPLKLLHSAGDLGAGIRDFGKRTPAEEKALLLSRPPRATEFSTPTGKRCSTASSGASARLWSSACSTTPSTRSRRVRSPAPASPSRARSSSRRARSAPMPCSMRSRRARATAPLRRKLPPKRPPSRPGGRHRDRAPHRRRRTRPKPRALRRPRRRAGARGCPLRSGRTRGSARRPARDRRRRRRRRGGSAPDPRGSQREPRARARGRDQSYRKRQGLGYLGGGELADHGLALDPENFEFSPAGYKAWKGSYKLWRRTVEPGEPGRRRARAALPRLASERRGAPRSRTKVPGARAERRARGRRARVACPARAGRAREREDSLRSRTATSCSRTRARATRA